MAYSGAGEPLYVGELTFSVRAGESNPYTDVRSSDWFYPYIIALTESGVIGGNTATTYAPRSAVTWGEALKMGCWPSGTRPSPPTAATGPAATSAWPCRRACWRRASP